MAPETKSPHCAYTQVVFLVLVVTGTVMGSGPRQEIPMDASARAPQQQPAAAGPPPGAGGMEGDSAGDMAAGGSSSSHRQSRVAVQAAGGSRAVQSSYSYKSSSSFHQSSEGKRSSGSSSSGSGSHSSGSSQQHAASSDASGVQSDPQDPPARARFRSAAPAPRASAGHQSSRGRGRASPAEASSSSSRDMSELDRVSALASDPDQRSYFRQLISRRCQDCTVKGQTYRGHSRFEYNEGCNRFRCICRCNGTYTCPPRYTMNVCKEGEEGKEGDVRVMAAARQNSDLRRRRCQTCEVLGQQFEGNAYFDYQDGCTKYRGCVCYCNGTWVCPSERAINTCHTSTPTPPPACRACHAKGKVVAANSIFELEEPCRRYRYCRCHCNGTWECPARFAQNTCQSPTASPQAQPGCKTCATPGDPRVPGNTYFQMKDGCTEYKNCVCRCNGTWSCPAQYARNVCQDASGSPPARKDHHLPASSADCQSCLAHRRYFRGNTYFNTRQGCLSYERCVCRCDGSWDCPDRYVTDLCRDDDPTNDVDSPNATCSFCDADGHIVPSNSFFNLTKDCVQYTHCLCHCDGAWSCPAKFSRNVCRPTPQRVSQKPEPERDCSNCLLDSRVVRGNSYFDFTSACFRYRDCLCKCDGTYHCEESRAENICNYTSTAAAALSSSSSSSSPSQALVTPPAGSECVRCLAWGQLHPWDTDFVHEEDCVEYECRCHCNGTHTCPMDRARRTCQPGCRECQVGGQFFEGNTYFQHAQGCVVYLCTCFCNGTYSCPPERANNTCGQGGEPGGPVPALSPVSDPSAQGGVGERRGECQQCVTKDGTRHAGGADFELREGCIDYQCKCQCDGSWNCPGHSARNTCRGEALGGCRSCVLSDSQIFRGGEEFQMRDGCIHYQCTCDCDGSWNCPGELARDICLGEVPGGCRVCRVSRNETYRGGSAFQLRQGCHHYRCQCHCNGSWECPGETARDVCMGEVPGGCRVCKLDSGQVYLGESDFQMEQNCIHYQCRCNCDGSWECPGGQARRVCNADGSPLVVQPPTTPPPPAQRPSCRRCMVSDQESFAPLQPFTLRRGCHMYHCQCECDGSWNCPAGQAKNLCQRREDPVLRARTCSPCRVSDYTFPGRSTFLLTRGCAQYSCRCDCQGRWTCNHTVVNNICQDDRQGWVRSVSASRQSVPTPALSSVSSDRSPQHAYRSLVSDVSARAVNTARGSSVAAANLGSFPAGRVSQPCRPCRVEGRRYDPNTDFELTKKCKLFHCRCSCNGRWRCPRDRTEDTCGEDAGYRERSRGRLPSPGSNPQPPEGQRYGRANVRVIGADAASSSSSSFSSSSSIQVGREGQQQGHRDRNVRGYYVRSGDSQAGRQVYRQADYQQYYGQADRRQNGPQLAYGHADNQQVHSHAEYKQRSSQGQEGGSAASSVASAVEVGGGEAGQEGGEQCTPCQVDDKTYRAGAQFDWRRGCVVYKCSCLCSSSYRCRLSVDPDCQEAEAPPESGGIPTGPAVEANRPGGSCGNCYVQGFVYPGNMSFSLRQGCKELRCHCGCDGTHQCANQKPIPGCVAMSTPLGGAVYPYGAAASSAVYPLGGGAYGVRPGRIVNSFQQTFYSNCPSCSSPGQQGGGVLIPAMLVPQSPHAQQVPGQGPNLNPQQPSGRHQHRYPLAAEPQHESDADAAQLAYFRSSAGHADQSRASQYPVNPQSSQQSQHAGRAALQSGGSSSSRSVQYVRMRPVPAAAADNSGKEEHDDMCAICFVNGGAHQGGFQYTTDCSHVTCHCDCAGRLQCSVQQSRMDDCPAQLPPSVSGGGDCGSCLVQNQQHPGNAQFALRLGCYGYVCTCGCDGRWACPRQQPTNYCVQPPPGAVPVEQGGVVEDSAQPAGTPPHGHVHRGAGRKAGLQDMTFGRSAEPKDGNSLLRCTDCQVRGTTYPSRTRFLLRDGCLQHTCHCDCDGTWACDKAMTVDVCQQQKQERQEQRQEEDEERRMQAHKRALAEASAHQARVAAARGGDGCRNCVVKGDRFLPNADFELRQDCDVFTCHCRCNGSWDCPPSLARNVCRGEERRTPASPDGCHPCHWGNRSYAGGSNFSHVDGCWQFDCRCGCGGAVVCPPNNARDLCRSADSQDMRQRLAEREGSIEQETMPPALDCKPCLVDGQVIRSRTAFTRKAGCWEWLCQCECNGSWTCPPDRSLDTCHLHTPHPPPASPDAHQPAPGPKGCRVGRKTYFTRLFAYRDGCVQHMCICYDSGAWRCPQGKERHLC